MYTVVYLPTVVFILESSICPSFSHSSNRLRNLVLIRLTDYEACYVYFVDDITPRKESKVCIIILHKEVLLVKLNLRF